MRQLSGMDRVRRGSALMVDERGAFCLMYEKYMALNICKEGLMVDRRAFLVFYAHLNIFFFSIRTKEVQSYLKSVVLGQRASDVQQSV